MQIARFILEILVAFKFTCNYNLLINGLCFGRNAFSIWQARSCHIVMWCYTSCH